MALSGGNASEDQGCPDRCRDDDPMGQQAEACGDESEAPRGHVQVACAGIFGSGDGGVEPHPAGASSSSGTLLRVPDRKAYRLLLLRRGLCSGLFRGRFRSGLGCGFRSRFLCCSHCRSPALSAGYWSRSERWVRGGCHRCLCCAGRDPFAAGGVPAWQDDSPALRIAQDNFSSRARRPAGFRRAMQGCICRGRARSSGAWCAARDGWRCRVRPWRTEGARVGSGDGGVKPRLKTCRVGDFTHLDERVEGMMGAVHPSYCNNKSVNTRATSPFADE